VTTADSATTADSTRSSDRPGPPPAPERRRRTIAVSGSASGIGAAVKERFEKSGLKVVGVDRHDAEVIADLSTADGRREAVEKTTELAGGHLDGVVACAGLGPHVRPFEAIPKVNYFGALAYLDGLLPALSGGEAPAAVAISSNGATLTPTNQAFVDVLLTDDEEAACAMAETLDGATVYGMSKLAMTIGLRRRAGAWAEAGVRLNAVAPGPVNTPLLDASLADKTLGPLIESLPVPVGRRANPNEIAGAVGFLLDPVNSFIHGSLLFVDGGSDALIRPDRV
jgi:NAD(P)-dependent dehydrogenase (short-subunit alcohol dehydrogenase family)